MKDELSPFSLTGPENLFDPPSSTAQLDLVLGRPQTLLGLYGATTHPAGVQTPQTPGRIFCQLKRNMPSE
jgi:hypothetical protein